MSANCYSQILIPKFKEEHVSLKSIWLSMSNIIQVSPLPKMQRN